MSPSSPPEPLRGDSGPRREGSVACPHCASADVVVESEFGSSLMTRQYYCRGCRTVFEWVKWEPTERPSEWLEE